MLWLAGPSAPRAQPAADETALGQLVERWVAARNANDADAMRPMFDEQVDQVRLTTGEVIARDLDGLVKWFDAGFKGDGKGTTARVSSQRARVLSPDAGLVDYAFTLHRADQTPLLTVHATFVCIKRGAAWKVAAVRFASPALSAPK